MRRPRYADVAATLALLLALSGTAVAAATALAPNSVGTAQLRADAVTSAKIAPEAVTLADILGADIKGKLSFSLDFQDCDPITIKVPGAKDGQVALFSFTSGIPEGVAASQPSVGAGEVTIQFCNSDSAVEYPLEVTDAPFRVVTFG